MSIIQVISLIALAFCLGLLLCHFIRLIKLGKPQDYSTPSGSVKDGVIYSNTVAMMPGNKESAYMHFPTYTAGILYHLGTFLSFLLYILSLFSFFKLFPHWLYIVIVIFLSATTLCGIVLFFKRLSNKNLHNLTNKDDYLSNGFTTFFQLVTALFVGSLLCPIQADLFVYLYYIGCIVLFIYMPFSKLKHLLYYFAARYHLGFFYGRRNVWPPQQKH